MSRARLRAVVAIAGWAMAGPAAAATIHGEVFADANRNGVHDAGEPGVAGVVVAFDVVRFTRSDASGQFTLEIPDVGTGIVWARVPDGYQPGPVWQRYTRDDRLLSLALSPTDEPGSRPLVFVVASDPHVHATGDGAEADLAAIVRAATALPEPPAFFTILGDITQGGSDPELDIVDRALDGLGVPYVPVPGNHDWYDDGVTWLRRYGPDNYSFDVGDVHFVVWNMAMGEDEIRAYLGAELAYVDKRMTIVALTHAPPAPGVIDALRDLGVAYVLTGHAHGNRMVDHDGVIELNTEPLLMGGLDVTPAGYRVMTISGGKLTSVHHAVVDAPYVAIASPAPGACGDREVVAAVELDAPAHVTARVDCGQPFALAPAGGWSYRGKLPVLAAGQHALEVDATAPSGAHGRAISTVDGCGVITTHVVSQLDRSSWGQLGRDATHAGASPDVVAPPLSPRWTTAVGGHIVTAAPAIADGLVVVATTDLADGSAGGVVALDLATGAIRWRARTPVPVRGGPAISHGLAIVPRIDGVILALDLATGAERWRSDLSADIGDARAGAIFASPAIDDGDVLIGSKRLLAALDVATGTTHWRVTPVPGGVEFQTAAAVAIGGGLAVGNFQREMGGLLAYDRATGKLAWQLAGDAPIGIQASPVIAGGQVIVANAADEVFAVDLLTGELGWRTQLDPAGFSWGNATVGTPAVAHGIAVVPTLYGDAVALDTVTGSELWRHAADPSPLRTTHYRGAGESGYAASPAIAGDVVWLAATDGTISALNLWTGDELWRTTGPPVLAGLALAGDAVIVASFDGTVRALAPPPPQGHTPLPASVAAFTASRLAHCDAATRPATTSSGLPSWLLTALLAASLATAVALGAAVVRRR